MRMAAIASLYLVNKAVRPSATALKVNKWPETMPSVAATPPRMPWRAVCDITNITAGPGDNASSVQAARNSRKASGATQATLVQRRRAYSGQLGGVFAQLSGARLSALHLHLHGHRDRLVARRHGRDHGRGEAAHQVRDLHRAAADEALVRRRADQAGMKAGTLVGAAQVLVGFGGPEHLRQHHVVAAAVTAFAGPGLDFLGRAAQWNHARRHQVPILVLVVSGARRRRAALDDGMLQPALGAVEGDRVALPGIECVQGVAQRRAGLVFHDDVHRVLDADLRPEHAAIAVVAVVLLVVEIQRLEVRI